MSLSNAFDIKICWYSWKGAFQPCDVFYHLSYIVEIAEVHDQQVIEKVLFLGQGLTWQGFDEVGEVVGAMEGYPSDIIVQD